EHRRSRRSVRDHALDEAEPRRHREDGDDEGRPDDGDDSLDALLTGPHRLHVVRDRNAAGGAAPTGLSHEGRSTPRTLYPLLHPPAPLSAAEPARAGLYRMPSLTQNATASGQGRN